MNVYSFRAECQYDVDCLAIQLMLEQVSAPMTIYNYGIHPPIPDVMVEMYCEESLEYLQDVLRRIQDSHVMLQTLRPIPLRDNKLERNYHLF